MEAAKEISHRFARISTDQNKRITRIGKRLQQFNLALSVTIRANLWLISFLRVSPANFTEVRRPHKLNANEFRNH
jgi:hypothetical protein